MRSFAVPALLIAALVAVLGALVWVNRAELAEPAAVPRSAVQPVVPAPQTFQPSSAPDGSFSGDREKNFQVGVEVMPGLYQTEGRAEGAQECRWERLRDTAERQDEVVAWKAATGPMTVLIKDGDDYFRTKGCKPWRLAN